MKEDKSFITGRPGAGAGPCPDWGMIPVHTKSLQKGIRIAGSILQNGLENRTLFLQFLFPNPFIDKYGKYDDPK